ncbi:uncharacterized protein LOC108603467 [Drosophila busckii]|uniref:uncharacterized protein LOC108603467 n=1 Tax=Drosophila busckii TaxID=30019 RepID=UPI00083EC2FC|nr:uncharacterized protein LOC108603467 [Drosophila busckii]
MKLFSIFFAASLALCCVQDSSATGLLTRLLHPTTTTTTEATTTTTARPFFINNNLPQLQPQCTATYVCKKKLTHLESPFPCVKYCVRLIECPNNVKTRGKPNQCVELDEQQVLAHYEAEKVSTTTTEKNIMRVAMIDFPCQPGYLPDSRGRCREIW